MSKVIYLDELRVAKKIVSEVPGILVSIDKSIEMLYTHHEYQDVYLILNQLTESRIMLGLALDVYKQVLKDINGKL